jgi:hypothetical protein
LRGTAQVYSPDRLDAVFGKESAVLDGQLPDLASD